MDWIYGFDDLEKYADSLTIYSETEMSVQTKYWIVFYNAVIMSKGNELGPRLSTELILGTVILLLDLIVAGTVFGKVAFLV